MLPSARQTKSDSAVQPTFTISRSSSWSRSPSACVALNPGVCVDLPRSEIGPLVTGSLSPSTSSVPSACQAYCMSEPQRSSRPGTPSTSPTAMEEDVPWVSSFGQPAASGGLVVAEIVSELTEPEYDESRVTT